MIFFNLMILISFMHQNMHIGSICKNMDFCVMRTTTVAMVTRFVLIKAVFGDISRLKI